MQLEADFKHKRQILSSHWLQSSAKMSKLLELVSQILTQNSHWRKKVHQNRPIWLIHIKIWCGLPLILEPTFSISYLNHQKRRNLSLKVVNWRDFSWVTEKIQINREDTKISQKPRHQPNFFATSDHLVKQKKSSLVWSHNQMSMWGWTVIWKLSERSNQGHLRTFSGENPIFHEIQALRKKVWSNYP